MSHEYKLCPSCHEEFTLAATECVDCGTALIFADAVEEELPEDFPPVSELVRVRVGPLPWTRALSAALSDEGIAHRVERDGRGEEDGGSDRRRFGGEEVYGTWVEPEQIDAARQLDRSLFGHLEPGASPTSDGEEVCPACQEPISPDDLACPGCGLGFG